MTNFQAFYDNSTNFWPCRAMRHAATGMANIVADYADDFSDSLTLSFTHIGTLMAPCWYLGAAVPWWADGTLMIRFTLLVLWWYLDGTLPVPWLNSDGTLMAPSWHPDGTFRWYFSGTMVVPWPWWYQDGPLMAPWCFDGTLPCWYLVGTSPNTKP